MASSSGAIVGTPVTEGVGRIPGFVNCYTLRVGEETYLIDTGFQRRAGAVVAAFRTAHVPLTQVHRVLLTHHHIDHRGGGAVGFHRAMLGQRVFHDRPSAFDLSDRQITVEYNPMLFGISVRERFHCHASRRGQDDRFSKHPRLFLRDGT